MPSKLFQPGLLDGQVAIVSGGGSGLGRASALELAALGARVVVCGRREEPLEETAAQADGGRVEARVCDIREGWCRGCAHPAWGRGGGRSGPGPPPPTAGSTCS